MNISIIDDSIGEPYEHLTVVVEPHEPSERITILNGVINITIQDNERKFNQKFLHRKTFTMINFHLEKFS